MFGFGLSKENMGEEALICSMIMIPFSLESILGRNYQSSKNRSLSVFGSFTSRKRKCLEFFDGKPSENT